MNTPQEKEISLEEKVALIEDVLKHLVLDFVRINTLKGEDVFKTVDAYENYLIETDDMDTFSVFRDVVSNCEAFIKSLGIY